MKLEAPQEDLEGSPHLQNIKNSHLHQMIEDNLLLHREVKSSCLHHQERKNDHLHQKVATTEAGHLHQETATGDMSTVSARVRGNNASQERKEMAMTELVTPPKHQGRIESLVKKVAMVVAGGETLESSMREETGVWDPQVDGTSTVQGGGKIRRRTRTLNQQNEITNHKTV